MHWAVECSWVFFFWAPWKSRNDGKLGMVRFKMQSLQGRILRRRDNQKTEVKKKKKKSKSLRIGCFSVALCYIR